MTRIRIALCTILFALVSQANAQEVVNLVYVGDKGITENLKEANAFIVVKQYPNGTFERLDYKLGAPLLMLRTYSDSTLSIQEGTYLKYDPEGNLSLKGQYSNNVKDGKWYYYNDTGKVTLEELYEKDVLVKTINPDTVKPKPREKSDDDRNAEFGKGKREWTNYILKSLGDMPAHLKSLNGKVRVLFVVDTDGKVTDLYLRKSAQFGLDELSLQVVRQSPPWTPAFQDGHHVKAYRVQPFTYVGESN